MSFEANYIIRLDIKRYNYGMPTRERRDYNPTAETIPDGYRAENHHTRRSFLGILAASTVLGAAGATGAMKALDYFFPPERRLRINFDVNYEEGVPEINPETKREASLQIFKDFVSIYINKEHDDAFWTGLFDFMRRASKPELDKYFDGDISKPDGAIHVTWPQDAPINRDDKPIIELQHLLTGSEKDGIVDITNFMIRLTPDGKINTDREAPNPPKKLFNNNNEMKAILSRVFKEGALKKNDGWREGASGVSKHVQIQREGKDFSMDEYGYVHLSVRYRSSPPATPSPNQGVI